MARVVEVDLFRGLALAMILVDHNAGSVLAHGTLRNVSVADASEIFVLLSGFASAAAYTALEARQGSAAARRRFLRRARTIYGAYLLMGGLVLALGAVLAAGALPMPSLGWILPAGIVDWPSLLAEVATLRWQPYLTNILPVYVVTALLTPSIIPALRRWPWAGLAVSTGIWLLAPVLAGILPARPGETWLFNPFAWQLAFVLGALIRLGPVPAVVGEVRARRVLTLASVLVLCVFAGLTLSWRMPALHDAMIPHWLGTVIYPISKPNFSLPRVLSLLALAWLGAEAIRSGLGARAASVLAPLVVVGRNSLPCFVASGPISILSEAVAVDLAGRELGVWSGLLSDALALGAFFLVGYAAEQWRMRRRKPVPAIG